MIAIVCFVKQHEDCIFLCHVLLFTSYNIMMMIESQLHKNEMRKMQYIRTRKQYLQFIYIYYKIQERKDPGQT